MTTKVSEANLKKLETESRFAEFTPTVLELPKIHPRLKEFCLEARPTIEGRPNIIQFIPYMQRLYEDEWLKIMIIWARQGGKTTYDATRLGHQALKQANSKSIFCTHQDLALSVFSNEKFRDAFWFESPIAREYIQGSTYGSLGYVSTKINSSVRLVTDAHGYIHVAGQSSDLTVYDEVNYQDLDRLATAKEAQSFTVGAEVYTGIGGFLETAYHHMWEETNQNKWKFLMESLG